MSEEEKIEQQSMEDKPKPHENVDEIISQKQPIEVKEPQTKNMEVHHHGHVHEKKKWKEYVFQFFMLFLAVFCGFLAEYQLEHVIEQQRAKVYASNLFEELKKDTISINNTIKKIKLNAAKLDSFCFFSAQKESAKIPNSILYYYAFATTTISFYTSDNTTIEQLKNSGNLRIMGNNLSQKISFYQKLLHDLDNEYQLTRPEFAKMEELYFKIFDGNTSQLLNKAITQQLKDSVFKLNIPLVNDDPKLMKEFTGWMKFEVSIYMDQIKEHLLPIKNTAIDLLILLKKEYHLE
jgi:hypothetical protein